MPIRLDRDALNHAARVTTAAARCDPDFLIIGAMKSGTTSLFAYLQARDDIRTPLAKEIHYFDINYSRGKNWYRSYFPLNSPRRSWLTGEASPLYLLYPQVPRRVYEHSPDIRLIALLRHPVDRAYSHFNHTRVLGLEPITDFAEALRQEPSRTDEAWRALCENDEHNPAVQHFSYIRRSLYAEQLERWISVFGAESLLVLIAEDLFSAPQETSDVAARHLGLVTSADISVKQGAHNARSYSALPVGLREELAARFEHDAQQVEALIGRPTGWTF